MERLRGLDFTSQICADQLGYRGTDRYDYQSWPPRLTRNVLRRTEIGSLDSILDIGCGKGRALTVFAQFPFQKIAGIECSPYLCAVARSNMARLGLSERVRIVETDALEYDDYGQFTIFFMFNPFGPETLRQVLAKIEESRSPIAARRFIYAHPLYAAELTARGGRLELAINDPLAGAIHLYVLGGQTQSS